MYLDKEIIFSICLLCYSVWCSDDYEPFTGNKILREWSDNILLKSFAQSEPDISTHRTCDSSFIKTSCSWGRCDDSYTGAGNVTMSDGSTWSGTWSQGVISGWVTVTYEDDSVMTGYYHDNCLQDGLVSLQLEFRTIVGLAKDGLISGSVWIIYHNREGYLYTELEQTHTKLSVAMFTGDNVTWLYPDLVTTLCGSFVAGTMLSAREGHVTRVDMTRDIPQLTVDTLLSGDVYHYDPSTDTHMSSSPMIRDVMERKYLKVTQSSIKGAGVGVFAKSNIPKDVIIGYFNGIHVLKEDVFNQVEKSVYLVEGVYSGEMLDVLPEYQTWSHYQASTGHLINHDKHANVEYIECHHPRFGHILCLSSLKDIKPGKELFVKYNVAIDTEGVKFALKTALQFGQMVTGKSKKEFVREIKPYVKTISKLFNTINVDDFIRF